MSGTAETLPTEDVEKFRKDALGISKKMIEIIKKMVPVFGEDKSIKESDDYEDFVQNKISECDKYKRKEVTTS